MNALGIVSGDGFRTALAAARQVEFGAYVLGDGATRRALLAAEAAGASVRVRLAGATTDPADVTARNAATVAALRGAGIDAALVSTPGYHVKAAVVDGVVYFDDANFRAGDRDVIVQDARSADVATVSAVVDGAPPGPPAADFSLRKREAVALEVATIAGTSPGDEVSVASESFGPGPLAAALAAHARAGGATRLIVDARELAGSHADAERRTLGELAAAGVAVGTAAVTDKLCIAGSEAWTGSANGTGANPAAADWGLRTNDPEMRAALLARFAADAHAAHPFVSGVAGEERPRVRGGAGDDVGLRHAENLREQPRRLGDERGLVPFAAMGDGGEIRRVGLQE